LTGSHDHSHEHDHEHEHHHHEPIEYRDAIRSFRSDKDEFFRTNLRSPIPEAERAGFEGLPYFPVDEALRFDGLTLEGSPLAPCPSLLWGVPPPADLAACAKYLLGHERMNTGRIGASKRELAKLTEFAAKQTGDDGRIVARQGGRRGAIAGGGGKAWCESAMGAGLAVFVRAD
jgi:hypothetical protein